MYEVIVTIISTGSLFEINCYMYNVPNDRLLPILTNNSARTANRHWTNNLSIFGSQSQYLIISYFLKSILLPIHDFIRL